MGYNGALVLTFVVSVVILAFVIYSDVIERRRIKLNVVVQQQQGENKPRMSANDILMASGIIILVAILLFFALLMVLNMGNFFDTNS